MNAINISRGIKFLIAAFTLGSALVASAATITIDQVVGRWDPGSAYNNPPDAFDASDALIEWTNGNAAPKNLLTDANFDLSGNFLSLPDIGSYSGGDSNGTDGWGSIDASVTPYVVGKFANISYLFYLGGSGTWSFETNDFNYRQNWDVPTKKNGDPVAAGGLSHWLSFTGDTPQVPDSGTSAILVGLGLIALGLFRRQVK